LRERRVQGGVVRDEDSLRAVGAELPPELLDARATEDRSDILSELCGLAENAQRVLLQLAFVVLDVDERGQA
jgi:hypothetical protein